MNRLTFNCLSLLQAEEGASHHPNLVPVDLSNMSRQKPGAAEHDLGSLAG